MRVGGTHAVPSPWCSSARAARPSPSAVPRPRSILCTWGRGPRDGGQERVQLRPCPWCACPMRAQHPLKCTSCQPPIRTHLSFSLPAARTVGWAFTPSGPQGFKDSGRFRSSQVHPPGSASKRVSGQPVRDCPPHLWGLAPLPGVVRGPVGTATCSCDQRHAIPPR